MILFCCINGGLDLIVFFLIILVLIFFLCFGFRFKCVNGLCIDMRKKCDYWDDCGDGFDEVNCGMYDIFISCCNY